jgi:hypothetical protein
MTIAFLFLVYDKIIAKKNIKNLINDNNLYIHPKYKDQVDEEFKKYIINDLVETEWCNYSIVQATLNLLKEAFKNKKINGFFYYHMILIQCMIISILKVTLIKSIMIVLFLIINLIQI